MLNLIVCWFQSNSWIFVIKIIMILCRWLCLVLMHCKLSRKLSFKIIIKSSCYFNSTLFQKNFHGIKLSHRTELTIDSIIIESLAKRNSNTLKLLKFMSTRRFLASFFFCLAEIRSFPYISQSFQSQANIIYRLNRN